MLHLRGVLGITLILLVVQVLAEGGMDGREFGSVSSGAIAASDAQSSTQHALVLSQDTAGLLQSASKDHNSVSGGYAKTYSANDLLSRTEDKPLQSSIGGSQEIVSAGSHYGSQAAHYMSNARNRRATADLLLTYTFSSTATNESIAQTICGDLNATVTTLVMTWNGPSGAYLQMPACVGTSSLTTLDAEYMTTSSFSVFPTTLSYLYCRYCRLRYDMTDSSTPIASTPAAQTVDGFNPDGTLNWTEIFTTLSNVSIVDFLQTDLRAALPTALPGRITFFRLQGTAVTGEIPAGMLFNIGAAGTSLSSLYLELSDMQLNGSVPSALFSGFSSKPFRVLNVFLSGNQLSGSLPANLFLPLQSTGLLTFNFELRSTPTITGALPTFGSGILASGGALYLNLPGCGLSSPIPDAYFDGLTTQTYITVDVSDNKIIGPLPTTMFPYNRPPLLFHLNFANNLINGSLTSFFSTGFQTNTSASTLILNLANNKLTGTIPETLLFNYYFSKKRDSSGEAYDLSQFDAETSALARSSSASLANPSGIIVNFRFELVLANNSLTGTVPPNLLSASFSQSYTGMSVLVDFSNNKLNGTIPNNFFAGLSNALTGSFQVMLNNNSFSGSIPNFCRSTTGIIFDASRNNFTGSIPSAWTSCKLNRVLLNNNPLLSGSIPATLLNTTGIIGFEAKNTSLTGFLPKLSTQLVSFDLSATQIEFCDATSLASISTYNEGCLVSSSLACDCAVSYAQCGASAACFPEAPSPPTSVPISSCPPSTRPGPDFTCVNGRWTATVVTAPVLNIPPGAGTVVVLGDVESGEVIISGLSSSVEVNGCANNLTSVSLQLTKEQIEQIGSGTVTQTLISTSGSGCNNLNSVNLNAQVSNQGCKKLKTTKQVSPDGSTLSAVFSLQTSSCNTWWIILVSVICGSIVIAVIIIVTSVVCCSCCKRKVRPYAGTDGHHTV